MPTYPYQCQNCGNEFEQYQKFTDKPLTKCPKCKKNKLQRVVVPSAIVFKGSGWYKTDSRTKSTSTGKNGSSKSAQPAADGAAAEKPAETAASTESKSTPAKKDSAAKSDD